MLFLSFIILRFAFVKYTNAATGYLKISGTVTCNYNPADAHVELYDEGKNFPGSRNKLL